MSEMPSFEIEQPDGSIFLDDGAWWDWLETLKPTQKAGPPTFAGYLAKGRVKGHYRRVRGKRIWIAAHERKGRPAKKKAPQPARNPFARSFAGFATLRKARR